VFYIVKISSHSYFYETLSHVLYFFLDRRNDKTIINSYTQVEVPGFESHS